MKIQTVAECLLGMVVLAACTPFLPRQETSDPTAVNDAAAIPVYASGGEAEAPKVKQIIGPVEGDSCKFWIPERKGTEAQALQQMRLAALKLGANGIIRVRYKHRGASFVTNCWQSVTARGLAVKF